jgi:hypothetical protein
MVFRLGRSGLLKVWRKEAELIRKKNKNKEGF